MKPINPLPVRKSLGKLTQAELYAQVKDSTERNRQFFFIWIAFALYVIVTTVATSDLQLLLSNATVKLPVLGIHLPLIGFFLVTPWLVLILHFNLLQNLDSHSNKLMQWANTYPNQTPPRAALPAFLFDFAMLEQGGVFAKLTQVSAQLVFYAVGPLTIGILLWRFSDYQSWQYTASQMTAFLISIYFVVTASLALNRKHRLKVAFSEFNYWLVYVPIILVVVFQTYLVFVLAFQTGKPFIFKDRDAENERYPEIWLPRISVINNWLLTLPSDIHTRMALDGEKDLSKWWTENGFGANLGRRNLKYARLDFVDLRGANLEAAQLQGVNLLGAQLQTAVFVGAQLQKAELSMAKLQDAMLWRAQMQGVDLFETKLHGADLQGAQLQGANLINISFDVKTLFRNAATDINTQVFDEQSKPSNDGGTFFANISNLEKIFVLREKLRNENGLILPDILYQQLFASPTKYTMKNRAGKFEEVIGVGRRETSTK